MKDIYYKHKYQKYKTKYKLLKEDNEINKIRKLQLQTGGNNQELIKLEGVTPDLYIPKDVAIVGNTPSLIEKDHSMIDKHQYVIRINCSGLNNDKYKSNAGAKCDIFCIGWNYGYLNYLDKLVSLLKSDNYKNSCVICRQESAKDYLIKNGIEQHRIFTVNNQSHFYCNWSVKNCLEKVNIDDDIMVSYDKHKDPNNKGGKYPTTGFMALMFVISSGIKPHVYGFSKEEKDIRKSLSYIYMDDSENGIKTRMNVRVFTHEHDVPSEHRIINKLIDKNIITFIE